MSWWRCLGARSTVWVPARPGEQTCGVCRVHGICTQCCSQGLRNTSSSILVQVSKMLCSRGCHCCYESIFTSIWKRRSLLDFNRCPYLHSDKLIPVTRPNVPNACFIYPVAFGRPRHRARAEVSFSFARPGSFMMDVGIRGRRVFQNACQELKLEHLGCIIIPRSTGIRAARWDRERWVF